MYEVNGSRAIITGSAQGFGKEFAKRLLENGCKVCLTDINEVKGLETKDQFQKEFKLDDNGICFIKCDIAAKEAWSHLWDYAEEKLRGPVDILINNAGLHPKVCVEYHYILNNFLNLNYLCDQFKKKNSKNYLISLYSMDGKRIWK